MTLRVPKKNKIQNTSNVVHKGVNKLNLLIFQAQQDPVFSSALVEDLSAIS